ncbi:hypothetical protein HET73_03090 [Wolbachia endosymbiont of Atemnus politus]|nr:hypothetical protein [Wolbachia endosymbiont of Atemnus politus]
MALNKFSIFAHNRKLTINPTKSEVSVFTINNHLRSWRPTLLLNNRPISFNVNPKYLGVTLDPSLSYKNHIDNIVTRAKKRLNIIKYISGKDWGANAKTLRITYLSLIRPILEYSLPVWISASKTNIDKVDRIQASAAKIICGLRNTTPNDLASFEADLLPLDKRRELVFTKFILKSQSAPRNHRTGKLIRKWKYQNRLKRISPMHLTVNNEIYSHKLEKRPTSSLAPHIPRNTPIIDLSLNDKLSKQSDIPAYLKNESLQLISEIDQNSIFIYTDGSLLGDNRSGSGVYIRDGNQTVEISISNPKGISIYKAELNAINTAIIKINKDTPITCHIFSDSRAALSAIDNCFTRREDILIKIAKNLNRLHPESNICLHWVPAHVGIPGNEKADALAKAGAEGLTSDPSSGVQVSFEELLSHKKHLLYTTWKTGLKHHWYCGQVPGESIKLNLNRKDNTALSRLKVGHTRPLIFKNGRKQFPLCNNCNRESATPEHLLLCMGLCKEDLYRAPTQVIQALKDSNLYELA